MIGRASRHLGPPKWHLFRALRALISAIHSSITVFDAQTLVFHYRDRLIGGKCTNNPDSGGSGRGLALTDGAVIGRP